MIHDLFELLGMLYFIIYVLKALKQWWKGTF